MAPEAGLEAGRFGATVLTRRHLASAKKGDTAAAKLLLGRVNDNDPVIVEPVSLSAPPALPARNADDGEECDRERAELHAKILRLARVEHGPARSQ